MLHKLGLYYRTIKHLKPIQVRYRLWYILRNKFRNFSGHSYPLSFSKEGYPLNLKAGIPKSVSCNLQPETNQSSFTFLNQSHTFDRGIDWNFSKYGKLWAYNLNYFDYLHQPDITKKEGLALITDFIDQIDTNEEGLEPYPVSLRGINWIKFLSNQDIHDEKIDASLYAQYQILMDNLEYHLLGNHLLENGCSLLFGAYYFQDQDLYRKAKEILSNELEEQVLSDGGHFERSTMYHGILLERLLDCYNVVKGNEWFEDRELEELLRDKAELMLGWLGEVAGFGLQVEGYELPLLNDAAKGVGPALEDLFNYADRLGLKVTAVELGESGYRRYSTENFTLICDVGNIGPDYQPGHAHSDTFSFVLYHQGKPVIIDPGISTYENNERRQLERSTEIHNTVQFEDKEQSEVWHAFRVGHRAKVDIHIDNQKQLAASHDGYQPWGITHKRSWQVQGNSIHIVDNLVGNDLSQGTFYLHFHPSFLGNVSVEGNCVKADEINIKFESADDIKKYSYHCPDGYNQYIKAPKIEVQFINELESIISLNTESTE